MKRQRKTYQKVYYETVIRPNKKKVAKRRKQFNEWYKDNKERRKKYQKKYHLNYMKLRKNETK